MPLLSPRGDPSSQKKQQLLRWCQGEELLELLPFHTCDTAPGSRRELCLLQLQVQHIHARFAVFLTGKGILNPPRSGITLEGGGGGMKNPSSAAVPAGVARSRCGSGASGDNKGIFGGLINSSGFWSPVRVVEALGWDLGIFPTSSVWINGAAAPALAENPGSSSSRELLESQGILVADIDTFVGSMQEMAAPFRRSYW